MGKDWEKMRDKIYKSEELDNRSFDVLMESYRLADAQLEMRIQQRDNLGIQLMVAFGALISAMTVDNELLRRICILAMPIVTFYFCNQVFSSYDVHSRLVYFIKNNIEIQLKRYIPNNIFLWEHFCEYDRKFKKGSKLGGRKEHFMIINVGVPIVAMILYFYFFGEYKESLKSLLCLNNFFGLGYFSTWIMIAIAENRNNKLSYEKHMLDLIAKCGYLDEGVKKETNVFNKALFIDRDGTIHIDKVETRRIEDLEFFDDVFSLLITANKLGYKIVIVTNQSGIGKGHYEVSEMQKFNEYMIQKLQEKGVKISTLYYCPHKNQDNCQCKKPKDGMFRRAAMDLDIDLSKSIMIGDQSLDAYAGLNAGIGKNYIVTTGRYNTIDKKYHIPEDLEEKVEVVDSLRKIENLISN